MTPGSPGSPGVPGWPGVPGVPVVGVPVVPVVEMLGVPVVADAAGARPCRAAAGVGVVTGRLPVVAVLTGPRGASAAARAVLVGLSRWAEVRAAGAHGRQAQAFVATDPAVAGVDTDRPLAVWVEGVDQVKAARSLARPCALVTADPAVADALAGAEPLLVGPGPERPPPLPRSPFVRRRWRRRAGFPADWVVRIGPDRALDELTPTALSLCAAAAVLDPATLRLALAAGAPTVTDPTSAAAVGALDGVHVVVGSGDDDLLASARELALDDRRAAGLGRAAVALFAERHQHGAAIRRLADRLGLPVAGTSPHDRAESRVEELHTPDHALPVERLRSALLPLPRERTIPA